MIAILSVESTGTHLTVSLAEQLLGERFTWNSGAFVFTHVYPLHMKSVTHYATDIYEDADKIIVPMRDPLAALISNHDRGEQKLTWREHALAFLRVMSWCGDKRVLYLPWDVNSHLQSESDLANHLAKTPTDLDWTPRNVTNERSALRDLPREDAWDFFDPARKILRYAEPFWTRLGYDV